MLIYIVRMNTINTRLLISRPQFAKTLALLFTIMADVFGRNSQASSATDATDIIDLVDLLHHAVMMEAQAPGEAGGRPRPTTLVLCAKAVERLRPDVQALFRHLSPDPASSIYAATHPKLTQQRPSSSSLMGGSVM